MKRDQSIAQNIHFISENCEDEIHITEVHSMNFFQFQNIPLCQNQSEQKKKKKLMSK